MLIKLFMSALSLCSFISSWFANIGIPYSCSSTIDRYDLRRLDWNIPCTHGTLQKASIMCNSEGSGHVFLATYLLLHHRNAWTSLAGTHNTLATPYSLMLSHTRGLAHKHTKAHTCTKSSLRPHSLHTKIPFISCYWLLLYPVAWLDHTRQHLTSSVFPPCSHAPSLTHSNTLSLLPSLLPYLLPCNTNTLFVFAFH